MGICLVIFQFLVNFTFTYNILFDFKYDVSNFHFVLKLSLILN